MTSTPRLTPEETINFALMVAEAGELAPSRAGRLVLDGLRIAGYQVVPHDGAAEPPKHGAAPKIPVRDHWPKTCAKCNKVINDRAHAESCDRTDCPF